MRPLAAAVGAGALLLSLTPAARSVVLLPPDSARYCAWSVVYPGKANYAWPDTNASYINQAVLLGPKEKAVITGRDPKARYWSITTYNLQDREVIDVVNDVTVRRSGPKKTWTVTVSPKHNPSDPNSLKSAGSYTYGTPLNFKQVTVIMYRVYLPESGGYSGGTLPTITVFHDDGIRKQAERLKACTPSQVGPPDQPLGLEKAVGLEGEQFVRADGGRFYPSYDTAYLAAEAAYDPETVLVITGKAPRVRKDVRYWSICQNVNEPPLPVVDCVADIDIATSPSTGKYTVALVGPGQVPDMSAYPGVTFLEWADDGAAGPLPPAFLIVRHILASKSFKESVGQVPLGKPATSTMGEYAPIIERVPIAELRAR
jgi:hypothetical protein